MVLTKEDIGQLIKKARMVKATRAGSKYTQGMLADDLGVSRGYLGDIETGRTYPNFLLLNKIATACEVPMTFFSDETYVEAKSYDLGDINRYLANIPNEKYIQTDNIQSQSTETVPIDSIDLRKNQPQPNTPIDNTSIRIPILRTVADGVPLYAEHNILDYEEVPLDVVKKGEYFFLIVQDDSMTGSRIYPSDKVLIRRQTSLEDGKIGLVLVNGNDHKLRRVNYISGNIKLSPTNSAFESLVYPANDVTIIGNLAGVVYIDNGEKTFTQII